MQWRRPVYSKSPATVLVGRSIRTGSHYHKGNRSPDFGDVWDRKKRWELKRSAILDALKIMAAGENGLLNSRPLHDLSAKRLRTHGGEPELPGQSTGSYSMRARVH